MKKNLLLTLCPLFILRKVFRSLYIVLCSASHFSPCVPLKISWQTIYSASLFVVLPTKYVRERDSDDLCQNTSLLAFHSKEVML
jgi:hypothetical protein